MLILKGLDSQADPIESKLQESISLFLAQGPRITLDGRFIERGQIETVSDRSQQFAQLRNIQLGRCASSQEER